jgi:hypothetical protein
MFKPFAFSFDRETFRGEFSTREQAVDAGLAAATQMPAGVEAVYVGKRQPVDPVAEGHAEDLIAAMRQRMADRTGDYGYLRGVNEHVAADLDAAVEHTIVAWLRHHNLAPADRFVSISEHTTPLVKGHAPSATNEVTQFGSDE